jgi:hypothetical protein
LNFESSQLGSSDRTERCLPHFLDSERLALSRNGDALTPKEIFDDEFLNSYRHQTSSLKFFSQNSGEKNFAIENLQKRASGYDSYLHYLRRRDTQHNDIQHNDTQQNNTQQNKEKNNTQHYGPRW